MPEQVTAEQRYLDLLKRCLTRYDFEEPQRYVPLTTRRTGLGGRARKTLLSVVRRRGFELMRPLEPYRPEDREVGRDWPPTAETMIGLRRLDHLQALIEDILAHNVRGDLIEAGVWRGGASIFMRGVLAAFGSADRTIWVADSFEGLPEPDAARYPSDAGDELWTETVLAVPLEEVQANFHRYGLLDEQVRFLKGWFRETLPAAPIDRLALLRLDGDMYESTIQALDALYPKLSPLGYVIVDDYSLPACREAVADFRRSNEIDDPIVQIDWTGAYWQHSGT
jgi:O-methyltransferase